MVKPLAFGVIVMLMLCSLAAQAIDSFETPKDPVLAQRYQSLTEELRCLVCQNQNLADSGAGLASDLKLAIIEQLEAGRNDREIVDYMKARYGDFVSYDPPVDSGTMALWIIPLAILALGVGLLVVRVRFRSDASKPTGQPTGQPGDHAAGAEQNDAIAKLDALLEQDSKRG